MTVRNTGMMGKLTSHYRSLLSACRKACEKADTLNGKDREAVLYALQDSLEFVVKYRKNIDKSGICVRIYPHEFAPICERL